MSHTHTHTLGTSVADRRLSPLSLPTPESLSCFFCCSMSSTLQTHKTGHTPDTHTQEEGREGGREVEREREAEVEPPPPFGRLFIGIVFPRI